MGVSLILMFLGVLVGVVTVSGFLIILGIYAFALLVTARVEGNWPWPERPVPSVEGTRLIQRRGDSLILSEIDLTAPFQAECTFHSDRQALIRVRQGSMDMRFPVPVDTSEQVAHVLRDTLGLQWPPQSRVSI
jgi:hypothetical protein